MFERTNTLNLFHNFFLRTALLPNNAVLFFYTKLPEGTQKKPQTPSPLAGANAADQHHTPSETRTLKAGECVLIDMGCIWNGYCSDMTRTFYCKSVDDEQAAIHNLVRTAVEKAEAVIKPGVRFCDIDAQARDLIDEAGYSEYWRIRLGHFIGQEDHEYGDVSPINKNVAEPGMIFSIEPGIYLEGKYGVRVEDLVLVTEDGHELLNAVDKKYRIVG